MTHLQAVSAWKRLNASTQLKLQVNTYIHCLLFCTGYTSTGIMLHSGFIFGDSYIQFSFQRLVILTEVCGCYHIPSKKIAEESTVTSCCILSKSLFSNTVLFIAVISELQAASLNTTHIYTLQQFLYPQSNSCKIQPLQAFKQCWLVIMKEWCMPAHTNAQTC